MRINEDVKQHRSVICCHFKIVANLKLKNGHTTFTLHLHSTKSQRVSQLRETTLRVLENTTLTLKRPISVRSYIE